MNTIDYSIIAFVYAILIIISIAKEIKDIKKNNKVKMSNFFKIYYILSYFITPIICLKYKYNIERSYRNVNYENPYHVKYFYIALLFSIVGYLSLNIGLKIKIKVNKKNKDKAYSKNPNNFLLSAILILIIGWIALFLWTHVYGSLTGIFKYASAIRSGYVEIKNKFTYVKPFCPFLLIAFYMFFIILLDSKNKKAPYKILLCIGLIVSFIGSYIYIIANDGRMLMIIFFLVLIFYYLDYKKIKTNIKSVIIMGIVSIMSIGVLGNLDAITAHIRLGRNIENSRTDIIETVGSEFSFVYFNNLNILFFKDNGIYNGSTELADLKSLLFSWVPTSMKMGKVVNLYDFNTSFYPSVTWNLPTDLITASIYKFGYIGIIILPIFVGMLAGKIEKIFEKKTSSYSNLMYYLLSIFLGLRFIVYYDLSQILFGSFYIILSALLIKTVDYFSRKKT